MVPLGCPYLDHIRLSNCNFLANFPYDFDFLIKNAPSLHLRLRNVPLIKELVMIFYKKFECKK